MVEAGIPSRRSLRCYQETVRLLVLQRLGHRNDDDGAEVPEGRLPFRVLDWE